MRTVRTKPAAEERTPARRCGQCGEILDAKRATALTTTALCGDCSFDAVPCTD